MSDRARRTYPISVKFSEGELPSAAKLTAISTQAKNALSIIETMIGDIWNQAGDNILSPSGTPTINALHIPNIARSIGDMGLGNTLLPSSFTPLDPLMLYFDDVGTNYAGQNRGYLKYKPADAPSAINMILTGTFAPLTQGQFQSIPSTLTSTGEWSVDSNGVLYTFDAIPSTLILRYKPIVTSDISDLSGASAAWNVIPDPTTWSGNYAGVKISFANNVDSSIGYHIWLPPRKPLDSTKTIRQSPISGSGNTAANAESGGPYFFQDPANNASIAFADHYRYRFPKEITQQGGANDVVPSGFIFIWDETTGTIIDGVSFFVPGNTGDRNFKIRATGANLVTVFGTSIGNGIITDDTTQLQADYKIRFKIITVGASAMKILSHLNKDHWNHVHKKTEGTNPISHADLDNLVTPGWDPTYNLLYPSGVHSFNKSIWPNDDHPQYLHRAGSTGLGITKRDHDDNAVWNKLIVKSPYTTPGFGALFLSADANGAFARISAPTGTGLVFDGASSSAGNLSLTQVNAKLYFNANSNPGAALATGNFIQYRSGDNYDFFSNNTYGNVTASLFSANRMDAAEHRANTSFTYVPSKVQYLHVSPHDIVDLGICLRLGALYVYNDSTGTAVGISGHLKLPNGAVLDPSQTIRFWSSGNGTTGTIIKIVAIPKPTSGGYSTFSGAVTVINFTSEVSNTNGVVDWPYDITHTIDNSPTGNYYVVDITFPVKISTAQPKFHGMTLTYLMPQVDN